MENSKNRLPVGIESFEELLTEGFYYIDKTSLIKDLLNKWGKVNLFTRPRRFGKSLNMSMLKSFFEIGCNRRLFDGLNISQETALCQEYMGKFPVIAVSFKDVDGNDFCTARSLFSSVIGNEAMQFQFLLESDNLSSLEKEQYLQLVHVDASGTESFSMPDSVLMGSLKTLSALLSKHYRQKVILLVDEYDVPLSKAQEHGYYNEMVLLLRNMLQQSLKTNDSLFFSVLTGCLRVAKESIFTGLNNMKIFSVTDIDCDSCFGFTDDEVKNLLSHYSLTDQYEQIRSWYDGYRFGETDVYCPWDVINYVDRLQVQKALPPQNYWINTSSNTAVRHFIEKMGNGIMKTEIEALVAGECVTKEIHDDLTYNELYTTVDNLWSMLYMTGYLTQRGITKDGRYKLVIPNMEIRSIFIRQIISLFKEDVAKDGELLKNFCDALQTGNASKVQRLFQSYMKKTISIRDTFVRRPTKENFYHGLLLGILAYKNNWYLKSNKESGNGYSDIFIKIENQDIGIILEIKYTENLNFSSVCNDAIAQINKNGYVEELKAEGCHTIFKYGIACHKKECGVIVDVEN